jgi:hypothetical protein
MLANVVCSVILAVPSMPILAPVVLDTPREGITFQGAKPTLVWPIKMLEALALRCHRNDFSRVNACIFSGRVRASNNNVCWFNCASR